MDTASYIPNNPQFGLLQFECTWPTVTTSTLTEDLLDNYQLSQDKNNQQIDILADVEGVSDEGVSGVSLDLDCCWSSEQDMILSGSVGAMGLDLDPLPTLFPFSPLTGCQGSGQQHGMATQDGNGLMQHARGNGNSTMVYKAESSPATSPSSDPLNPCYAYQQHHCTATNHRSPTDNDLSHHLSTSPCDSHGSTPDNVSIDHDNLQSYHKIGEVAADVLLSLKHAVVHPGDLQGLAQVQGGANMGGGGGYYGGVGNATSAGSLYGTGGGMIEGNSGFQNSHHHHHHHHQGSPLFPSMSVNVSMNMTMHGYHPAGTNGNYCPTTTEINYPQVQWSATPHHQCSHHHQSLLTPPAPYATGAIYSITADFRPVPTGPTLDITNNQLTTGNNSCSAVAPVLLGGGNVSGGALGHHQLIMEGTLGGGATYKVAGGRLSRRASSLSIGSGGGCYSDPEDFGSRGGSVSSGSSQKTNVCRICGKSYARPSTLKTHLRTHSGEKPYRCSNCTKSFSQAANLTAHVRTHSGEKPFRCPVCDRRFSQSSSVTTHMRTHSGERPYRCRLCRKAFSDSSTLTKHLRIHSGEKPYECKLCLLRFSQSGNLNRHMRVHNSGSQALLGLA